MPRERMPNLTLRERRLRARRWFNLRVCLLLTLISGIAYCAWLAPWARAPHPVQVEAAR